MENWRRHHLNERASDQEYINLINWLIEIVQEKDDIFRFKKQVAHSVGGGFGEFPTYYTKYLPLPFNKMWGYEKEFDDVSSNGTPIHVIIPDRMSLGVTPSTGKKGSMASTSRGYPYFEERYAMWLEKKGMTKPENSFITGEFLFEFFRNLKIHVYPFILRDGGITPMGSMDSAGKMSLNGSYMGLMPKKWLKVGECVPLPAPEQKSPEGAVPFEWETYGMMCTPTITALKKWFDMDFEVCYSHQKILYQKLLQNFDLIHEKSQLVTLFCLTSLLQLNMFFLHQQTFPYLTLNL